MTRTRTHFASAAARASRWLCAVPLEPADTERQLQRLFALSAAHAAKGNRHDQLDRRLRRQASELPGFGFLNHAGDPLIALAVHASLRDQGIEDPNLAGLAQLYASVLRSSDGPLDSDLALCAVLLNRCGLCVPEWRDEETGEPAALDLIHSERDHLLESCRRLMMTTGCGTRAGPRGGALAILPGLCVSFALRWDIEAVSVLLRACAYIGTDDAAACRWALEWLLSQQQADGRFGLLALEARRAGEDPDNWKLYFAPTVGALWTLAEIRQPGFLVKGFGSLPIRSASASSSS